ncbi:aminoacyl-tRNA hydrolase [Bacteroidales bacterium OttesenSCG-928-B11]|nr:aminoacyl-tRNA hydrolase [Bacteroidales bacterium OttesenSCG-928-C03]MDL2311799.1 aminoacyl-tRNA hydrolase [Bacteroidales bacterium OttesenSCG-928-B11]MDL2326196.1 aminoacyl-tRNA hydrolase [Bacteroidales bacterium OttesenSCG-928-A14]
MEENKKFLIFGLGNAENKYTGTRHNIGFEVVNALAENLGATFKSDRYAYKAEGKFKGRKLILLMPTTYMNLSGKAVRYWMEQEKVEANQILVITDDIDLPPGTLRLKGKGSGGTHNGLNNIIETLGHQNYPRLRFGIGKNYAQGYQIDYVLGKFERSEWKELIEPAIQKAVGVVKSFVTAGMQRTMEQCNAKDKQEKKGEDKTDKKEEHII